MASAMASYSVGLSLRPPYSPKDEVKEFAEICPYESTENLIFWLPRKLYSSPLLRNSESKQGTSTKVWNNGAVQNECQEKTSYLFARASKRSKMHTFPLRSSEMPFRANLRLSSPQSTKASRANLANHCLLFKSSIPSSGSSLAAEWKKKHKVSYICRSSIQGDVLDRGSTISDDFDGVGFLSIHHVGILCENLERSLDFYQNLLGLEINEARPDDKLPYRGAWLWVGSEMIHLMELPNPDPTTGRPEHGGRDRHACLSIRDVSKLKEIFDKAGIPYTLSRSGRPAIFARDPDGNALEFVQAD